MNDTGNGMHKLGSFSRRCAGLLAMSYFGMAYAGTPTLDDRAAAAATAAVGSSCSGLNFYWEIGDKDGNKRSGNGPGGIGSGKVQPTDQGPVASAGKWLYGAYVLQTSNTPLDATNDIPYLNMTSGYESLKSCTLKNTVGACGDTSGKNPNNPYTSGDQGKFYYDSGHFEAHAYKDWSGLLLLSGLNKGHLSTPIATALNIDDNHSIPNPDTGSLTRNINVGLKYDGLVLAADASIDASTYTSFLRQVLAGTLKMSSYLTTDYDVCASNGTDANGNPYCTNTVQESGSTPPLLDSDLDAGSPADGSPWKYSLGHWIEKDGTFSSPGALGFYPWIDKDKKWYGVVARYSTLNILAYQKSIVCGRAIRNAWINAPASN